MSDFDPDKFLAGEYDTKPKQLSSDDFDPDAFLSGAYDTKKPVEKESKKGQTFLENYGDTLTMGYLPQLQAGAEKIMTPVLNAITGNDVEADGYIESRDKNRKRIEELSEENPGSAMVGKVAGIVNQAPILAAKAVQGAGALAKVGSAIKTGALYGAAQNPGDIEGELSPLQLGDRAKGAALGAAIGGAVQGAVSAAPTIAKGAKAAAEYVGDLADEKAAKVLGHLSKFEKSMEKGTAKQIGRVLREEGAIKPWTTTKGANAAVERIKEEAGQEIGKIIDNATPGTKIDTVKMADAIRNSETLKELANTPGMESAFTRINSMLDTLAKNGTVDLKQAQKLRQMVDRGIKFARRGDAPVPEEGLRAIRTTIRDTMNDVVNASDDMAGVGGKDRLLKANKKFSLMAEAEDIADQQIARDAKNRSISLTDTISGVAGAASGGPLTGIAAGLANKAVRTFGNSVATNVLGATEKALLKIPKFAAMAEKNPELFNSVVQRVGLKTRQGNFESLPEQIEALYLSAEQSPPTPERDPAAKPKESANAPVKGEDKWAQRGAEKLGLDLESAEAALKSKKKKALLIAASDLPEGSRRLETILKRLS